MRAESKLWLWKNFVDGKPEYWAFDNPFPINLADGDPQTLGEPCGYALFKPSRQARADWGEDQILRAIARASDSADTERHGKDKAVLSPDTRNYIASLVAERDALAEDAERYRWLRDKCGDSFLGVFKHAWDSHHRTWLSGATLDAAIDAASLSAKEPT
jgi:hypothetical protein